jgi:hypothetical protein
MNLESNRLADVAAPDSALEVPRPDKWNQNRLGDHQLDPGRRRVPARPRDRRPRPHRFRPALLASSDTMPIRVKSTGQDPSSSPHWWTPRRWRSALPRFPPFIVASLASHNELISSKATPTSWSNEAFLALAEGLYGEEALFDGDGHAFLEEPYHLFFKGDPALVEAVFQAAVFATWLGLGEARTNGPGHCTRSRSPLPRWC